jgi:hypothetical protein
MKGLLIITSVWLVLSSLAQARGGSEPCSRGKEGISHCENGKFICNDGSVSRSTITCTSTKPATPTEPPKSRTDIKPRIGKDGSVSYGIPIK